MSKDLMLTKMVEYILLNPDLYDHHKFFKENGWWHNQETNRRRSVCWCNAVRLARDFECRYIREDWYPIPKEDIEDYVSRIRKWEIEEVPFRRLRQKALELRYVQPGLPES